MPATPVAPASAPAKPYDWVEPVLWTLAGVVFVGVSAYLSETAREVLKQGLAYMFTFLTTPFVLEATTAFIGLCIVFAINGRRIAREGDGWVMMEVKVEDQPEEKKETAV